MSDPSVIEEIFLAALEKGTAAERAAFLDGACKGNPDLRGQVERLLDAHPKADKFLEPIARPNDDVAATYVPVSERSGMVIAGRYKLIENIGEGGMGSVWVAEQQHPVRRKVAVKLIKAGMDSKQVLARFEAERQALAVMDHPNIAKVFDGGLTEQGRPFFVMEYVKGVPFTEYCDKARLSLKERLTLFISVCQAVQHAHQKGIVHRDLKPSNILICLYDGKPVPKVIDFGLAKAMHQSLTDQSIYTGHGVMVGTPLYMSPEQAEHNNLDVDTRTDIYSPGVVLYELLVGTTPLERQQLQQAAFAEVLRLIKEVEPPRPSLRISSSASLASIAAQRSIDPKYLSRSVAGDLDWIVMKTLEKERSRRYETATGLARDIERFLNDEAVEACPPSTAYRLRKFIRKHRGQVIAAGAILLTLLIGFLGTSWGLFRAIEAEKTAYESKKKTDEALLQVTKERNKKAKIASELSDERIESEKQRMTAESALFKSILRPIGFGDSLGEAELRALADWHALGEARLQLGALEEALDNPATAIRIVRRAERVIQTFVGVSPVRRAAAIELTSRKQRDMQADPRIRVAACWLALELGSVDLPAFNESLLYLSQPSNKAAALFVEFAKLSVNRSDQHVRAELARAWNTWMAILNTSEDPEVLRSVSTALVAITPSLNVEQAVSQADALIALLKKSTDPNSLAAAGSALAALAPQLRAEQANRGWDALVAVLHRATADNAFDSIIAAHKALAPRYKSGT